MTFNKLWSEGDERQQKYCQSGQPGQDEVWGCIAPVRRVSHINMVLSQGTYSSSPQQQTVVEPRPAMYWVEHLFSCPVQLAGMTAIPTLPPLQPCSHWLWDELKCVTCCLYTCIAYREMVTFRPLHFLSPPYLLVFPRLLGPLPGLLRLLCWLTLLPCHHPCPCLCSQFPSLSRWAWCTAPRARWCYTRPSRSQRRRSRLSQTCFHGRSSSSWTGLRIFNWDKTSLILTTFTSPINK